MRLWLVEDDSNVRMALARSLSRQGYVVVDFATAEAAVAFAEGEGDPPAALVTDDLLAGLGGLQLVEALRRRWPRLPVVVVSGDPPDRPSPCDLEQAVFVRKPLTGLQLGTLIQQVLQVRPPESSQPSTPPLADGTPSAGPRGAAGEVEPLAPELVARLRADQEARWMAELVRHMAEAVVVTDLELKVLSWSPGAERMSGWLASEAVGRRIPDLMGPAMPSTGSRVDQVLSRGGGRWEALRQRKDGTVFVAATEVTVLRDDAGRPERLLNVSRDVTAEKRIQDALEEAQALNQAILSTLEEGVLVTAPPGRLLAANQAAERILGLSRAQLERAEAFPAGWSMTGPEGRGELTMNEAREALVAGRPFEARETRIRTPDGAARWVSLRAAALPVAGDDQPLVLLTAIDVTGVHEARRRAVDQARLQVLDARSSDLELVLQRSDGAIVHANDRAVAAYGYAREELLALPTADVLGAPGHPLLELTAGRIATEGPAVESLHRRKDGTTFPVELSARCFRAEGVEHLHLLVRDLTEARRRDAERRLLAKLVETMVDGVLVIDDQHRITHVNRAAEDLLGWAAAELVGHNLRSLTVEFVRGDGDLARERIDRGLPVHDQVRIRRKDGAWASLDIQGTPLHDDAGRPSGRLLVARDVGPALAAEQALREREETLRSIFTSMAEGVVFQDAQGRIISCNPAAERILGMTQAQMEGLTSLDPRWRALREDGSPCPGEEHPVRVSLRTGVSLRGVIMGVDANGQGTRWVSVSSEPLRRAPGEPPYAVVATFTDITELRRRRESPDEGGPGTP